MGKHLASIVLGTLLLLLSLSASSAPLPTYPVTGVPVANMEQFEQRFIQMLKAWRIPGAEVAIMKNNNITYARGFGWANVAEKIPVQPNSLFRIASVSKAITAITTLHLVQTHKLELNSNVFDLLNDIKPIDGKGADKRLRQMKIRDLLYMSSGWIPAGRGHYDPLFGPWSRHLVNLIGYDNLPASCKDTMRMMLSVRMHGTPGKYHVYSNLDYCLLGLVIDKVNNAAYDYRGYEHYVQTNILAPIGITDMAIGSTVKENRRPNEVYYYRYNGPINTNYEGVSSYLPYSPDEILQKNFANGGWIASAIDLVTVANAANRNKLFDSALRKKMLSPPPFESGKTNKYFAMGWKVKKTKEGHYYYQTGSFTGTNSLVIVKSDGTCIAFVFNSRPPVYHLWRDFRPHLNKLFNLSFHENEWQHSWA